MNPSINHLKHRLDNPMTLDEIQQIVPAAFAEYADESNVSAKYVFISTADIVADMTALGFKPIWAAQRRGKDSPFKKHWIKFYHPDHCITRPDGKIEEVFEVTVSNSHDGRASFNLRAGIFRLVCENGMMALDHDLGFIRLRHTGYTTDELNRMVGELFAKFPTIIKQVEKLKQIIMTDAQMIDFATKSLKARWDTEIKIDVEKLIKPIRIEDESNDVWSVYNRIQEKLTKGQFSAQNGRIIRSLHNVDAMVKMNEKLYATALEYAS